MVGGQKNVCDQGKKYLSHTNTNLPWDLHAAPSIYFLYLIYQILKAFQI